MIIISLDRVRFLALENIVSKNKLYFIDGGNQMVPEYIHASVIELATSKNLENIAEGSSKPKKDCYFIFKVMQHAGLEELDRALKISRMAVHKHLALLQERSLVESLETTGHVGRPRMMYQLTSQSKTIFPKSYSAIATHALDFIERNMGKAAVEKVLRERQL